MADVQLEHGFARVARQLLAALSRANLSRREFSVVLAVVNRTYGARGSPQRVPMTLAELAADTGFRRNHVGSTLSALARKGLIVRDSATGETGISKDYDAWSEGVLRSPVAVPPGSPETGTSAIPEPGPVDPETGTKTIPKPGPQKKDEDDPPPLSPSGTSPPPSGGARAKTNGRRWRDGETVPADWLDWAVEAGELTRRAAEREAQRFADYWTAMPGARGVKRDWRATWRNWARRAHDGANDEARCGHREVEGIGDRIRRATARSRAERDRARSARR